MLRRQGFEHLRIWPRGVNAELFQPERCNQALRAGWLQERMQPEQKAVILYVGRVSWEKNLKLLVQAYLGMDHERCHLVIVGDGPAYAELRQELADVPVTFTGYLSGAALAEAYASADLFAFPSFTETFGQVVLEAMASGLPIVGLLSDGVRDLVSQGQTGLLLDSESLSQAALVQAYQEQLTRLVLDRDLRQRMSQAALAEARRRSWYEAMESLVQGYREVVEVSQGLLAA